MKRIYISFIDGHKFARASTQPPTAHMPPALKKQRAADAARPTASASEAEGGDRAATKRKKRVAFARRVHERGLNILEQAGFKRQSPCEGIGDCWMISIIAGHERRIPINYIKAISPATRKSVLTKLRKDLFMFLTTVAEDSSKGLAVAEIMKVAAWLGVTAPDEATTARQRTAAVLRAIAAKLSPWKEDFHFGANQQLMHAGLAWMQQRNVLDIDAIGISRGECELHVKRTLRLPCFN